MNKRAIWVAIPAVAMGLAACNKKEETQTPAAPAVVEKSAPAAPPVPTPAPVPPPAPAPAPTPKTVTLGPEERAAKLGFVKYLPQETEVVMAFHNGSKSVSRIKSSKLWKLVQSRMGMGLEGDDGGPAAPAKDDLQKPDDGPDAAAPPEPDLPRKDDAEAFGPSSLFGTEFTVALGKSAGVQTSNLLTLNRRMNYFQMRTLTKAFVAAAKSGDFSSIQQSISDRFGPELMKDVLADPDSGIALFEKMKMPPLYFAFRTEAARHDAAAQQLASFIENLAMLGEMVEPVEVEKAGCKFSGQKISGTRISESMAKDRKELDEMLDASAVDRLVAAIAKKDLVVLSGSIGDYAVLFIGSSPDDLNLTNDLKQSLVTGDALAFCDPYASKDLGAVIYSEKGAMEKIITASGGIADLAGGLRDGLAGSEGLGDTRDLEALLRMVAERESSLLKLSSTDSLGITAFFEDGLKIESQGGTDSGAVDWKTPDKLAPLGDSDDVVMFANMTSDAAYDEKASAYLEALMETSYAVAMKISAVPMDDPSMAQFKEMAKMFDSQFRPDAVSLWDAFNGGFGGSLGHESAIVVDLNGSVPAIPGIPQPVVDQGKFPRVSMIMPVTDRAKLADSWQKMNTSATSILAKVSKMAGKEIPMQKPVSSDKNGYTTWFFPMPFFNDDFMPSVTVGDKWFAASSSKNQALDLVNKAEKGGETRNGLYFAMNFKALRKFSSETLKVIEKNSAAIFGADESISEKLKTAGKAIEAMDDLDKLTVHARREGGVLRTSVHFKTR